MHKQTESVVNGKEIKDIFAAATREFFRHNKEFLGEYHANQENGKEGDFTFDLETSHASMSQGTLVLEGVVVPEGDNSEDYFVCLTAKVVRSGQEFIRSFYCWILADRKIRASI